MCFDEIANASGVSPARISPENFRGFSSQLVAAKIRRCIQREESYLKGVRFERRWAVLSLCSQCIYAPPGPARPGIKRVFTPTIAADRQRDNQRRSWIDRVKMDDLEYRSRAYLTRNVVCFYDLQVENNRVEVVEAVCSSRSIYVAFRLQVLNLFLGFSIFIGILISILLSIEYNERSHEVSTRYLNNCEFLFLGFSIFAFWYQENIMSEEVILFLYIYTFIQYIR